jgi:uncharacterized SAM-binding protein YcdF (DUF218 family)
MKSDRKSGRAGPIAAGACFALAAFFAFALVGYGTTALGFGGAGLCALFYWLTARWAAPVAKALRIAVTVLLALGCGCFVAAELPIIAGAHTDADPSADFVVVMGAGVDGASPSRSMTDRLTAALGYLNAYPDSVAIVSGCRGEGEDVSEAEAMRVWLVNRGVSDSRIIKEEQARSSYENLRNSLNIIQSLGGAGKIAVVSSEYHLYRIRLIARALGFTPLCVAGRTTNPALMVNYFIREAFGVWRIWVLGPG